MDDNVCNLMDKINTKELVLIPKFGLIIHKQSPIDKDCELFDVSRKIYVFDENNILDILTGQLYVMDNKGIKKKDTDCYIWEFKVNFVPLLFKSNHKKNVIFIRHGESYQNISKLNSTIRNVNLTDKGIHQTIKLNTHMRRLNEKLKEITGKGIELIIISPLNRTLQTAYNGFKGMDDIPRECNILCCERIGSNASKGYNYKDTKKVIERYNLNAKIVNPYFDRYYKEIWGNPSYSDSHKSYSKRLNEFKNYLENKTETNIAVVCHSVFIDHYMRKTLEMGEHIREYTTLDNCRFYIIKHK